jgi:hypothetical protein
MSAGARLLLVILALGALAPGRVGAQGGTLAASVSILLPPVSGSGLRGLAFGTVAPGTPAEVLPIAALSGWFQLTSVNRKSNVRLTFTLPSRLIRTGGSEGLPIFFNGPYVRSCGNGCQTHTITPTAINTTQSTAEATHVRPGPPWGANPTTIDVYVGGRVEPTPTQMAGSYQGTIQLTFAAL